ncbi:MAG: class I SAM-dependent methyltransferase [Nitrospirae bacterium]|nr:class I SAM-dependent methyltransferase [Nitrospirota bacterium]
MLDVGCGPGYYLRPLSSLYNATGIDISEYAIELCVSEGLECKCISFYDVEESYNSIVCIDVLEHLQADINFLEKMYVSLSPKGKIFIVVPSGPLKKDDVFFGHYRRYERKEIIDKVLSCGFKVLYTESFGYPLLYYARLIFLALHNGKAEEYGLRNNEDRSCSSSYKHYADDTILGKLFCNLANVSILNYVLNLILSVQHLFAFQNKGFAQIVIAEKPVEVFKGGFSYKNCDM